MLQSFEQLNWQHRVIVIVGQNAKQHVSELYAHNSEINDRHIIWLVSENVMVSTNYPSGVAEAFVESVVNQYAPNSLNVLLIGNDGGIKLRSQAFDLKGIFRLIDAMPMRRQELSERNNEL